MTTSWEQSAPMGQTVSGGPDRERPRNRGLSPWLAPIATFTTQDLVLPLWFRSISVAGQEHIPRQGPLMLAPTHKARWDALLLPFAAGRRVTGRDCRFMVTIDEMRGLQGWLLQRLGCFAVNQVRPSLASLRQSVDLLSAGEQLVVFPEGRIRRQGGEIRLHQGLARLVLMSASKGVSVPVVPIGIAYSHPSPRACDRAAIHFGPPMRISGHGRDAAVAFTQELASAMAGLEIQALTAIGLTPPIDQDA